MGTSLVGAFAFEVALVFNQIRGHRERIFVIYNCVFGLFVCLRAQRLNTTQHTTGMGAQGTGDPRIHIRREPL